MGWYRISEAIGHQISSRDPQMNYCGTYGTGWIEGNQKPSAIGETMNSTVCFRYESNSCRFKIDIQIRDCRDYVLYYLSDTDCTLGYCVE